MTRILGLDIVRTIAILQVLLVHSTYAFSSGAQKKILGFMPAIDGVSIFFVLSGFLIGGILLRTLEKDEFTSSDLLQFWVRRWFRTLPNYFLVVLILLLYDIFIYKAESEFSWRYLFFAQNLTGNHPDFFPEAWSLSVEEWFYLSFPLICFLGIRMVRKRQHVVLAAAIFFLLVPFFLRINSQYNSDFAALDLRKIVIYRLDSLMYGILGAYMFRYTTTLWDNLKYIGLALSAILFLALTVYNRLHSDDQVFWKVYAFNVESLAALLAFPYFSRLQQIGSRPLEKMFRFVSMVSYALYVLNLSVIQWRLVPAFLSLTNLRELDNSASGMISYMLFWPAVFTGAYVLYKFYEKPMMNLRDKIHLAPHS